MQLTVKHGPSSIDVHVQDGSTGLHLKQHLEQKLGVFVRHQKLIHKGKVLNDEDQLSAQGLGDKAVVMLLATGNAGGPTKGQQVAQSTSATRAAEARARVEAAYAAAKGGTSAGAAGMPPPRPGALALPNSNSIGIPSLPERRRAWLRTGVVALRDLGLREVPAQVWADGALPQPPAPVVGTSTVVTQVQGPGAGGGAEAAMLPDGGQALVDSSRMSHNGGSDPSGAALPHSNSHQPLASSLPAAQPEHGTTTTQQQPGPAQQAGSSSSGSGPLVVPIKQLDLSHNLLAAVPGPLLAALPHLTSLRLHNNRLTDDGVPWVEIGQLGRLQVLSLDHNPGLTTLPGAPLAQLTSLRRLTVSHCSLAGPLPEELGSLASLELVDVSHNQVTALPDTLGRCRQLVDVEASHNQISVIPATFSSLTALQALRLDSNRITIQGVPSALLTGCSSLWLLGLTSNPVTNEQLRELVGWSDLDARRRSKADKQLEGRIIIDNSTRSFEEGVDSVDWQRWAPS